MSRTSGRTLLLFVTCDHIGQTPLANLEATLTADLKCSFWDSLSKPTKLKDCPLSDYFDLVFTALLHKILSADKFGSGIRELQARFVTKLAQILFSNLCIIGISLQMALPRCFLYGRHLGWFYLTRWSCQYLC